MSTVPGVARLQTRRVHASRCSHVRRLQVHAGNGIPQTSTSCCDSTRIMPSADLLIGNTPMIMLDPKGEKIFGTIVCKLEMMNGSKSVKDRIALAMVNRAEEQGLIAPGITTLVEPTSGNTGIALAFVAAAKGYDLVLTMSQSMSIERKFLLRGYGAKLIQTAPEKGMLGAIEAAEEFVSLTPNAIMLQQFENPANPQVHYDSTGPEIWADTAGQVDFLVAGVGTGGTISGTGQYLKDQNPEVQVIAVEPAESPVISGGPPGMHGIPGIGAGFIPATLDRSVLDDVIRIPTKDAEAMARRITLQEGLLLGISSGAAIAAAIKVAKRPESRGKLIVVILASAGERYLSTPMYAEYWQDSDRPHLYQV